MSLRIVIVGAGAIGCLTALELVRRGHHVILVDKGPVGQESSWAGGGILFPLLPWKYGEKVNRLALAGAQIYASLCETLRRETGIDPEYRVSGMRVFPDFGGMVALEWCRTHGMAAEMREDALWLPQVAQVRNPRLMQALCARVLQCGVELVERCELLPLGSSDGSVAVWAARDGRRFEADHYLVTAGAWSNLLLGPHAMGSRIRPIRGQMLLYRLAPGALGCILYQDDFYLIPRADGHILAGSTVEDAGFDKSTTSQAAAALHQKAVLLFPALAHAEIIKHWSGLRPGSPDNVPIIGRHPAFDNLWLNAGHFRYGVTMAPASAMLIADLIEGAFPAGCGDYTFPI
ncbi:MAG: FAD-dependent oxidoreductase [Methylophilaceae bacterium]|nr:FAD-dependent oxidoreductase [Methylophilaceae bacterium]